MIEFVCDMCERRTTLERVVFVDVGNEECMLICDLHTNSEIKKHYGERVKLIRRLER